MLAAAAVYVRAAASLPGADEPPRIQALMETALQLQFLTGSAAAFGGAVVLAIERRFTTTRGLLRIGGIAAVLISGLVALSITQPRAADIVAAAHAGAAAEPLLARWRLWLSLHVAFAAATLACYAAAPAFVRAPAPPTVVGPAERRLLLVLGSATFFEGFDRFIVTLALPYIGRDLAADEGTLGWALFWVRFGALLSLPLAWLADRRGRRGVLLLTVVGYTVATFVTAFTTTITAFVLCQLATSVFLVAELSIAHVVIAEEFPPHLRGFGLGMIGGFATLGSGTAAVLFPLMQATALGWRALYLVGIVPLGFVFYLRRSLPETHRWQAARAHAGAPSAMRLLRAPYARPLVVLVTIAIASTAAIGPAFNFFSYVATTRHGWSPAQVSLAVFVSGGVGVLGWPIGGRMADRFGRRRTGSMALALLTAGIVLLYTGPAASIAVGFSMLVFAEACVTTVLAALATESFPTAVRGAAKAIVTNAVVVGALVGLAAVGAFTATLGGAPRVIAALTSLNVLSLALLWTLPETAGSDLERLDE